MHSRIWNFDLTGRVRKLWKRPIKIEQQLTEVTNLSYPQRSVLALARYLDTQEEILLKIYYDLRPEPFEIDDLERMKRWADNRFLWEIDTVKAVQEIGHGPRYITHGTQTAGEMFPYPEGKVSFIVMSRVKGENVADIREQLTFDELEDIRGQLTTILEHLRQEGRVTYEQSASFLRYDREDKKLYFIDFTFMQYIKTVTDMPEPITPDNIFVFSYNLWTNEHLRKARASVTEEGVKEAPAESGTRRPSLQSEASSIENSTDWFLIKDPEEEKSTSPMAPLSK